MGSATRQRDRLRRTSPMVGMVRAGSAVRIRDSGLLVLCALIALSAPGSVRAIELDTSTGQHDLAAQMVGRGAILPGGCRFTGGSVGDVILTAEYACSDGTVTLELSLPDAAPRGALRTDKFALVVRHGTPAPQFLEAVAARIRAGEARFDWKLAARPPDLRVDPVDLLAGACGVVVLGLAVQYLLARRRIAADLQTGSDLTSGRSPPPPHPGRLADAGASGPLVGLVALYVMTRLWALTRLPVYIDEAYHIDWARDGLGAHLLPQILVGKWLPVQTMALFMLLPVGPLYGARLASVAMGLAILLGCVCIDRELFSLREGILAGVFYAILPFALLYDRLALADLYVAAFGAWLIFFSIATITRAAIIYPLGMTVCASGAIFSKPTGGVLLAVPLLASVLLVNRGGRTAYVRLAMPTVIAGTVLLGLLLAGGYGTAGMLSQSAFEPAGQLSLIRANSVQAYEWLVMLLTPVVAAAVLAALVWALLTPARGRRAEAFLATVVLLAIGPYVVFSRKSVPGYLLFTTVPVSLLLGRAVAACATVAGRLGNRRSPSIGAVARIGLTAAIVALLARDAVRLDIALTRSPENARLPETEHVQYVTAWSAGYGLPELAAFLRAQAREAPINVVRFKTAGTVDLGLKVYVPESDSIHLYSLVAAAAGTAGKVGELARTRRTFFVSNNDDAPTLMSARAGYTAGAAHVWSYSKPGSQSGIDVWELPRAQP